MNPSSTTMTSAGAVSRAEATRSTRAWRLRRAFAQDEACFGAVPRRGRTRRPITTRRAPAKIAAAFVGWRATSRAPPAIATAAESEEERRDGVRTELRRGRPRLELGRLDQLPGEPVAETAPQRGICASEAAVRAGARAGGSRFQPQAWHQVRYPSRPGARRRRSDRAARLRTPDRTSPPIVGRRRLRSVNGAGERAPSLRRAGPARSGRRPVPAGAPPARCTAAAPCRHESGSAACRGGSDDPGPCRSAPRRPAPAAAPTPPARRFPSGSVPRIPARGAPSSRGSIRPRISACLRAATAHEPT